MFIARFVLPLLEQYRPSRRLIGRCLRCLLLRKYACGYFQRLFANGFLPTTRRQPLFANGSLPAALRLRLVANGCIRQRFYTNGSLPAATLSASAILRTSGSYIYILWCIRYPHCVIWRPHSSNTNTVTVAAVAAAAAPPPSTTATAAINISLGALAPLYKQ